jgi:hypothetical protein
VVVVARGFSVVEVLPAVVVVVVVAPATVVVGLVVVVPPATDVVGAAVVGATVVGAAVVGAAVVEVGGVTEPDDHVSPEGVSDGVAVTVIWVVQYLSTWVGPATPLVHATPSV